MERPVLFENENEKLYGILGVLDGEGDGVSADLGVVLVHGWGGCRSGPHQILVKTSRALSAEGIPALRFDLRGRGESEGSTALADLDGMISDTVKAAECLTKETRVSRVALLGICSGGNVAIGAATLPKSDDIDSVVAWSTLPFQPQRRKIDDIKKSFHALGVYCGKLFRLETWKKLFTGRVNFGLVKRAIFKSESRAIEVSKDQPTDTGSDCEAKDPPQQNQNAAKSSSQASPNEAKPIQPNKAIQTETRNPKDSSRDIMKEFGEYKGHMLFLYGGKDPEAQGAINVYAPFCEEKGLNADFDSIEGANHSFYSVEWEREVIEKSVKWIKDKRSGGVVE